MPTDPMRRISELEAMVAARDTRIAELTDAMNRQAAKVTAAHQARRDAELHAAGVLLESHHAAGTFNPRKKAKAGETTALTTEVSHAVRRKLNPDTKLAVHEHTKDCACPETNGARVDVHLKAYP